MGFSNPNSRNTIYFDESGVPSLKDKKRFFILTGVIANNLEFTSLSEYYFRLKFKYFNEERTIHASNLFWKPNNKDLSFIEELVGYLETLNFSFLTVVVNKNAILKYLPQTQPKNPFYTTFSEAKSIWEKLTNKDENFREKTIKEILRTVKHSKFPDANKYYPLRIAYYTILKEYLGSYAKKCNLENLDFEICFETSPNRERILKYTEEFYEERIEKRKKRKTKFAKNLKEHIYSISFPHKNAKYLGLEIADIISYGFNLSLNKRINAVPAYINIWEIVKRKRAHLKKNYGIECIYKIPKKGG